VGYRIEVDPELEDFRFLDGSKSDRIDDGRSEKPEGQQIGQDIFDIPEMNGQRRNKEGKSEGKDELDDHHQRQEEQKQGILFTKDGDEEKENGQAEQEMDEVTGNDNNRKDLHGEKNFFYQISLNHKNVGRLQRGGRKPCPGQHSTEEEKGIFPWTPPKSGISGADDEAKNDGVDDHQQKRVEEGPEKTEHSPPVTGFEFTADEILDENPVLVQSFEVPKKSEHGASRQKFL
jgi:hypothetical protein